MLLKFECHKLQRDLAVTEESTLKPLSRRKSRTRAIICSSESRRPRAAHHLPTNEFVKTDWFYWLLGWWRGGLLNVNVSQRGWIRRGAALSEKETLVALTALREKDVQKETEGNRHEQSWQPAISFSVKQRACWEPQWHVASTLSARTKHKSVNTHNTLICLSKQIHQLIIYQFSNSEATGAAHLLIKVSNQLQ